jgi:Protein of unknown function (DUF2939)
MRKVLLIALMAIVAAGSFALLPLYSAFDLSRAVKVGDLATLEMRVDWVRVRQSLKASLAEIERVKEESTRGLPKPSLWARIKAAASPTRYSDQIIDRYLTPDSVVQFVKSGGTLKTLLQKSGALPPPDANTLAAVPETELSFHTRALRFWNGLKRVDFRDLSTLELEVQDRRVAERRYIGLLEREGLSWRLVSVRVLGAGF